jgi:predicted nucleic acid-binding protein
MIHLDTNYLIGLAVRGSTPAANVDQWLAGGETLGASALAWTEFLNGPVSANDIALVETVIGGNVVIFEKTTATLAAHLFNQTGRRRGSRFDCLIAATAIAANAEFATENPKDFAAFAAHGLKLKN